MIIPPLLKPNDSVAIVAPAKRLQSGIENGLELLRSWGLDVIVGEHVFEEANLFAGTDQERLSDLQKALDYPSIKAVFMARGGYGSTRILDNLDFTKFQERPKWICGFSDITVLLQKVSNLGIASLHSTVPVLMGKDGHDKSDDYLRRALFEGDLSYEFSTGEVNRPGFCKGEICGGNLSMICNSIGTSSEIDTRGRIIFIEDVGEYLYHLDRMLVQLKRAGKFDMAAGVVVGYFTSMKDHQDTFGLSVNEIIKDQLSDFDFPIAFDFQAGHESPNLPIYFGREALLEVWKDGAKLNHDAIKL